MLSPEIRCVVGIDIAKVAHVVCALDAPDGRVRQRPRRIAATAAGHAQLLAWLGDWGAAAAILIGLEATGPLWEPLHDALTAAGYTVLVLNPRQTASWAGSLGLRAKTDALDAQTLALGLLAGLARASTLPSEAIQALRALTRTRRDLVGERTAARQRLHDELVVLFPEFVRLVARWPGTTDPGAPAVLGLLSTHPSARAVARAEPDALVDRLGELSAGRWGVVEATALAAAAAHSAAGTRAVAARGLVVRTLALHLVELQQRIVELEAAIADLLRDDADGQRLQTIPGIGPQLAATMNSFYSPASTLCGLERPEQHFLDAGVARLGEEVEDRSGDIFGIEVFAGAAALLFDGATTEFGQDTAGNDHAAADTVAANLLGQRFHQPLQAKLGRAVGRHPGVALLPCARGDRDDLPFTAPFQVRDRGASGQERCGQVGGEGRLPLDQRQSLDRPALAAPDVGDHDIEPAELGHHPLDRRTERCFVGHIGGQCQRPPARCGDLTGHRVQPLGAPRDQPDRRTLARQRHRGRAPHARTRPGHDRHLIIERAHNALR